MRGALTQSAQETDDAKNLMPPSPHFELVDGQALLDTSESTYCNFKLRVKQVLNIRADHF